MDYYVILFQLSIFLYRKIYRLETTSLTSNTQVLPNKEQPIH